MKRALKWFLIASAGLATLGLLVATGLAIAGTTKLNRTVAIQVDPIAVPSDEAALARGAHLVDVLCRDCHGADLTGGPFFEAGPIGTVYAPNLTGLSGTPSETLVRAIRHGLDSDGRQLFIMPSETFIYLSESDLGAMIAYLQSVPPAGDPHPAPEFRPLGRIMVGLGAFDTSIPAAYIDHGLPYPAMPEIGPSVAYGEYMARLCQGCHGADLAGAQPPDPDAPPAPNLTPGGALAGWTEADFLTALQSGILPSGSTLEPEYMPWTSIGKLDEEELRALWLYLQSLPPLETTSQ